MAYKQILNPQLVNDDSSKPSFSSSTSGELKIEFGCDSFVTLNRLEIRALRQFLASLAGQMPLLDTERVAPTRNYALEA